MKPPLNTLLLDLAPCPLGYAARWGVLDTPCFPARYYGGRYDAATLTTLRNGTEHFHRTEDEALAGAERGLAGAQRAEREQAERLAKLPPMRAA